MKAPKKILAVGVAFLLCFGSVCTELSLPSTTATLTASAASTLADFPSSYQSAADWIWTNRIEREQSTVRRNTLFDQIIAGNGELHYGSPTRPLHWNSGDSSNSSLKTA